MSGTLLNSFFQGNRSELLADYLMSGLGTVTPVRRQFDYGYDFICTLSDQESQILTFSNPYILQIKSEGSKITYGNSVHAKWRPEQIKWLFRQELPVFIGIVNRIHTSISIYNTTNLWCMNYEFPDSSIIELQPRINQTSDPVARPHSTAMINWKSGKGDGKIHEVDLGNPIITLRNSDFSLRAELKNKKEILRDIIIKERENIYFKQMGIKFFQRVKSNEPNKPIHDFEVFYYADWANDLTPEILKSLWPGLLSLAFALFAKGKTVQLNHLKEILKLVPPDPYLHNLKRKLPGLFDWF